ncbi:hypothetical protein C6501_05385 [Candidatus Poribacteria bacterium]|nr:MAG: hypothetical protein C6501_05385 [Candidatus Poribacteria bacterium]
MNLQKTKPLSDIYTREEDFSADLADTLDALNVGKFEDAETEANVGTRKADIVAVGEDGILVIENQFGKANWDHWGRLEAYARLKEADIAVLVAEDFEELMIVTCNLRNEDSNVNWYLIQAQANSHNELSFHHVARPAIDIQTEKHPEVGYSEFWAPIRNGDFGELFAGKPVPLSNEGWIKKNIRNVGISLYITNQRCYIQLYFRGENPLERRDSVMELFPESDYSYDYNDSPKQIRVQFPVLNKGKNDRDDWDEIREKLVNMGTDIYNKINESDL